MSSHLTSKKLTSLSYRKWLQSYYIFLNYTSFFTILSANGLFCTTQDTIFFIFIVDSLTGVAALRTEIEVAMKVENEHLTEIPHLGVLCVRSKGRRLLLLRGEWQLCRNTVKCYC